MPGGPDLSLLSHDEKDALNTAWMAQVAALTARVAELEAKLGLPPKTPDKSSLPPSKGQKASAPAKPKAKANPHAGAHRPLDPDPTRERIVSALVRQGCGADVSNVPQSAARVYDRIEIPEVKPDVTRVTLQGGVCPCCARRFKAAAPEGLEPGSPPRVRARGLRALVIDLRSVQGVPMARLTDVLKDLFGLDISEGALLNVLAAAREAFAAQTSLIKERLLSGAALASDETGMRVGKANWRLWVFRHGDSAALVADANRSKAVVETFLCERRPDVWLSDRLGSQTAGRGATIRSASPISSAASSTSPMRACSRPRSRASSTSKRACALGRRRADLADSTLKADLADLERRLDRLLRLAPLHPAGRNLKDAIKAIRGSLFVFMTNREIEAATNGSERVAPWRGLSKDHQRLPKRMGRPIPRRPAVRHRDRAKALNSRPRRHPSHAPGPPSAAPRVTVPTGA